MDDREFIEGLRGEDAGATRHLSENLLPSLWRYVYFRVKGDRHLAEDVVSETVMSLIKAVSTSGADVHSPSAWMRGVAAHKIQDHFRAVARVQHLIDQADSVAGEKQSVPAACEEEERRAAVRKVMDDLPEPHRLALEWKYVEHLSVQEIAVRMAITEKAVESILFRARREFRDGLGILNRDDVPFRLNGKSPATKDRGPPNEQGRTAVTEVVPRDLPVEVIANQPTGTESEQRRS